MLVSQFINSRGNAVKNHFIIMENDGTIRFQSYNSIVCEIYPHRAMGFDKVVKFGRDWNFSATTKKHLKKFLSDMDINFLDSTKEIEYAIEIGHIRKDESIAVVFDDTL